MKRLTNLVIMATSKDIYFVLFRSNPKTKQIKYYLDGEGSELYASWDTFRSLIVDLCGWHSLVNVEEALFTYDTFYLFDVKKSFLIKTRAVGLDGVDSLNDYVKVEKKKITDELDHSVPDSINIFSNFANKKIEILEETKAN